jgi:serine/threonine-protein kinase
MSSAASSPAESGSASTTPPATVAIPVLEGDGQQAADQIIAGDGLKFVTKSEANLRYPADVVIATNPAAGIVVPAGSTVIFLVSTGLTSCSDCIRRPVMSIMPDVCGLTYQQANTLLAQNGITLSAQITYQASAEPAGTIVGSVPAAGESFESYGPFDLVDDSGPVQVVPVISSGQASSSALAPASSSALAPASGSSDLCATSSTPPASPGGAELAPSNPGITPSPVS